VSQRVGQLARSVAGRTSAARQTGQSSIGSLTKTVHHWGRPMTMREILLGFVVSGLTATAVAQTTAVSEDWAPVGHLAQTITGRVVFSPTEIKFQNGKSLSLTQGAQMLFRPEAKAKKVTADLFRVTQPDDPVLENGNKLCRGKPVAYLIVWRSEKTGTAAAPRNLAPFSGTKFSAGSPDDCGRYTYDAGRP
jgi:hypothetical protein